MLASLPFSAGTAGAFERRVPEGYFGISAPGFSVLARDGDPALAGQAQGVADAGLDFVRTTVDWRQVEPLLGVGGIHLYDWSATDELVRTLSERDLEFVPNLIGTPLWARALDALTCTRPAAVDPIHAPAFGDLAGKLVQRYGQGGSFWSAHPELTPQPVRRVEIWNEPNWTGSWCPRPQPERFAALMAEAGESIRAADPTVETVIGGMVLTKENIYFPGGGLRGMESGTFLKRMVDAQPELPDLVDQVAIHLYDPDPDLNLSLLGWFRGRLEQAGLEHAGLLVTEFGWATAGGPEAISEQARAAAFTAQVGQLPRTDCDLRGIAAHDWVTPESDPNDIEDWFGLTDPATGALNPSGEAYRDAVALFEGGGPTPAPRATIPICGAEDPDQDGDGTPDEEDDYPLDKDRDSGSGEEPPTEPEPEQPQRPASTPDRFFSVTSAFMPTSPEQRGLHYAAMAELGVSSVRESVEWDSVEPRDGVSGVSRFGWADLDRRIIAYAKRGIGTSFAPLHAPDWLPSSAGAANERFAELISALARRYGSQGQVWAENQHLDPGLASKDFEIWTEVNHNSSAWDGSASAAEYAETYAGAREALLGADPTARAIVSLSDGGNGAGAASFLEGMVAARPGLAGGIDGVYVLATGARSSAELEAVVVRVREALERSGNPDARLRVGFGAPTGGPTAMSESARAAFVADAASRLPRLDCGVDEAVLFSWTSAQSDTANPWDWYGVSSLADGTPTPTASGFVAAARSFAGFGAQEPERAALHPCMRQALDRDGDGTPDSVDPAPLDPEIGDPDATPPEAPGFTSAPPAWAKTGSATFGFQATDAASFHCRVDSGAWQPCTVPRQLSGLADGPHSFAVRAVDDLGLIGEPSVHDWQIDRDPPETSILSGPAGITPNDEVGFELASDEPGSEFRCRLDLGVWVSCGDEVTYSGLAEGPHHFEAAAVDRAGNVDPGQEYRYFEVRTLPGQPSLQGVGVGTQQPTFSFGAAHADSFLCRFDGAPFATCSGAAEHTPARKLLQGSHRFEVRGVGPTGKLGPVAGWSFWVADTSPPETTIAAAPPVKGSATEASFTLTGDEDGVEFRCKLDGGSWHNCGAAVSYPGLALGRHEFRVFAIDSVGLQDATPAVHQWLIHEPDIPAPPPSPAPGPRDPDSPPKPAPEPAPEPPPGGDDGPADPEPAPKGEPEPAPAPTAPAETAPGPAKTDPGSAETDPGPEQSDPGRDPDPEPAAPEPAGPEPTLDPGPDPEADANPDPGPDPRTGAGAEVHAKGAQNQRGRAIEVEVAVEAGRALEVRASGRVRAPRGSGRYRLRTRRATIEAGDRATISLAPRSRKHRRRIRRALVRYRRAPREAKAKLAVKATIKVVTRAADGGRSVSRSRVTLR